MNALLDSIVYDRRPNKVKTTTRLIEKQIEDKKPVEKLNKVKSKTVNKDKGNKTVSAEKPKKKNAKSVRQHAATLDNSQLGSVISLASSNDSKIDSNKLCNSSDNRTKNKSDEIDSKQLRKKQPQNAEKKPDNLIQEAIKGFNYSGSIELKFEEALEVCADNRYDEIDEELGRNLFDDESDNYILETYNRPGDELIETYMDIEHRIVPPKHPEKAKMKPIGRSGNSLSLISDDEECIFVEAYNSQGYELRKTYSLIDKNASEIDPAFQARTLSITSDVQEYFNDIEDKCESEDQYHPACNTYMNYSKIIQEYKNKQQKSVLEKIEEGKSQTAPTKCDTENNVELPQPGPSIYENYGKTMEELRRKSVQMTISKDPTIPNNNISEESNSSAELVYEFPFVEDTMKIKFIPQTKSDFIIHELLETEFVYINNLKKILTDYLNYFRKFPSQSQLKINTIFGNIEAIYRQTIEFYHALVLCSNDYEAIGLTFIDYKSLFYLYPIYMKNKPKADRILLNNFKYVIQDRQKKLKDRLDLMSYLLNPIQRLGRYILLLENLQKAVRKSERLDPAVEILKTNMIKGNDAIAVESILQLPQTLDLYTKGSYIDREKFIMIKPKRQEIVIFLFEEIVVFTVENTNDARDVHTTFTYYDSIQMNDLSITIVDGELQTFQLADYPRCKKYKEAGTYIFAARDKKTRDHWGELIHRKLWEQLERFKDESKSYKAVSRANSTASARIQPPYSSNAGKCTSSASVSRESSAKKVAKNPTDEKQIDKSNDKAKRRTKKQKSDVTKRNSTFYTDPQNYKTM